MKFSLNWLQDYLTLSVTPAELMDKLTLAGTEVEHWEAKGGVDRNVVVAKVLSYVPHPNADRLRLCQVTDGTKQHQIVCGAKNFDVNSVIPLALPGAELPGGFKIKESKLRGELSQGMMCSGKELGLADDAEGLLILPADAPLGTPLTDYLKGDVLFDIEITPNRADLCSYEGLAREIGSVGGGAFRPAPSPTVAYPSDASAWTVTLENAEGPYYSAVALNSAKVGASPAWLKEKLTSIGQRSINAAVDVTNFVLWEIGQPLHVFDAAKIQGRTISVRYAKDGETIVALDGKTYALVATDLVIADASGPIAIAGVIGGLATSVTESTTEVVLEAAWFAPAAVRRTGRRLGIFSDAAYRYERRVNPQGVLRGRDRAVSLLQELTGAKIVGTSVVSGEAPAGRAPVSLRYSRIQKLLGVTLSPTQVDGWLTALGLVKQSGEGDTTVWTIPPFRYDLEREVDLIEEVARLLGLGNVPAQLSAGASAESGADRAHARASELRHTLAHRGWHECLTEALYDAKLAAADNAVELLNPLNEQYSHLRPSLRGGLLRSAAHNVAQNNGVIRLFELGRTYGHSPVGVQESQQLALVVAGQGNEPSVFEAERGADFFDLKGTVDFLTEHFGVSGWTVEAVSPAERKLHGVKTPLYYAETNVTRWLEKSPAPARFVPLTAFPAVRRDLAFTVAKSVTHEQVETAIRSAKIKDLVGVALFDVFEDPSGVKIPADRKSLAYALTYRASDRTLTDTEVSKWDASIREKLKASVDCGFRE
jgi:phenylalanyl-tRNA synthetase beta chain